jgi:nitroreductase/dihydropteridine reductase
VLASTPQAKQRIAKATQGVYKFNEAKVLNASHVLVFCAKTSIDEAFLQQLTDQEDQDGRFADLEAKVGQLNAKKYFVNMHRFDLKDANHWMEKQVYLNLGSLLLGVSTLGIDAVPIEGFDAKELDEEFALRGRGYTSLVIVPLGVRSDDDFNAALPKSRLPEAQLFSEF